MPKSSHDTANLTEFRRQASEAGLKTDGDCRAFCQSVANFYRSREEIEQYREAKCVPVPLGYCVAPNRDNPPGGMWVWLDTGFREWCDDTPLVSSFNAITDRLREHQSPQEVAQFWRSVGEELPYAKPYTDHQEYLLGHKDQPMANYLTNGSFEEPPVPDDPVQERLLADAQAKKLHYIDWNDYQVSGLCARDWVKFSRSVRTYSAELDTAEAKDGSASLCLAGTGRYGGLLHDVKAPNNRARYRVSLWYRTAGKFRSGSLGVAFYGLRSLPRKRTGLSRSPQWRRVALEFTSNYPAEQARFTVALMFHRSASPDAKIWFDDIRLEMLSPTGVARP